MRFYDTSRESCRPFLRGRTERAPDLTMEGRLWSCLSRPVGEGGVYFRRREHAGKRPDCHAIGIYFPERRDGISPAGRRPHAETRSAVVPFSCGGRRPRRPGPGPRLRRRPFLFDPCFRRLAADAADGADGRHDPPLPPHGEIPPGDHSSAATVDASWTSQAPWRRSVGALTGACSARPQADAAARWVNEGVNTVHSGRHPTERAGV